jgi:hypothetical protein
MRDRRILAFDEAAAIAAAQDAIAGIRERTASLVGTVTAAIPPLAARLAQSTAPPSDG